MTADEVQPDLAALMEQIAAIETAALAEGATEPAPARIRIDPDPAMPDTVDVVAFGRKVALTAPKFQFMRSDALWRVKHVYQPALASQTLEPIGVALDVGAGFGSFALPFALAFPGWQVYCFEPDPLSYDALRRNVADLALTNVVILPFGVGFEPEDEPKDIVGLAGAIAALKAHEIGAVESIAALLPSRPYSRHLNNVGYTERGLHIAAEYESFSAPTISAHALLGLSPRLLKLLAPMVECQILAELQGARLDHIVGETWTHVPAALAYNGALGLRQTWLPRAGLPLLSLRRSLDTAETDERLDVVVAMYNSRDFILDCIDGVLNGDSDEVRVLVVNDGSTDDSVDVVLSKFKDDPRVQILSKPNGGCASARNYGRLHSKASHIAFVDADDIPGRNLFAGLLDLARQTGAEIVQGGFEMLFDDGNGGLRVEPSYEDSDEIVVKSLRHNFGTATCHLLPTGYLMEGQPTIWRRVYRHDFLDNRKIWFPEHIRAFDDQIFQMLTLQSVRNVPTLDGVSYGYRQHAGQDIRQSDERNFYSLEMFRLILKRGISEGWSDFAPVLKSFVNTVNWIYGRLRPDLREPFLKGAAELWVYARKTLGANEFNSLPDSVFLAADFSFYTKQLEANLSSFGVSYGWIYLDSFEMQVPMVKSLRS